MDSNPPPQRQCSFADSKSVLSSMSIDNAQNDSFTGQNDRTRASIAERRAAKCGFKAERINTARFRTVFPLASPATAASPAVRSPCITIPPGISPTALLDSPIMLPNCQPSPTTGSFPFSVLNYESAMPNSATPAYGDKGSDDGSFKFKSRSDFATLEDQGNNAGDIQQVGSVDPSVDFEFQVELSKEAPTESYAGDSAVDVRMVHNDVAGNQTSMQIESVPGENVRTHHILEEEKGMFSAAGIARNSEDGYNWRKYGQKQVKGSEYPRSYYKCTHQNCHVKKKIERSYDGQITEIIYKGTHNHPKPQPNRGAQVESTSSLDGGSESCVKIEVGSVWKNPQLESNNVKHGSEWKADGLEMTSSTSVVTDLSDPLSITQGKSMGTLESAGTTELCSTFVSNDDNDDGATQGSMSLGVDADIEESESKRRKIENCLVEANLSSRAVREPRVVVQIESEIDILDDGYRWRKYGQKVVKGNPNPRSYYKCTSAGCSVRKHVERASHNLKFVITTYEGKHNHEVPAAKTSNNLNSSCSNLPQVTTNPQSSLALARNTNKTKPETQFQDYAHGFDIKPVFNNGYLRPIFGNFSREMKLGASSIYPLKFPTFQHAMPYSSLEFSHGATHHSGAIASLVPDFQISLPSSLHTSANLSLAGLDFNYNGKTVGQGQPFLSAHQLVLPKQEQIDDDHNDAGQATINHVNGSLSSSVYQNVMGNFSA